MTRASADKVYVQTVGQTPTHGYGLGPQYGGTTRAMVAAGYGPAKPAGDRLTHAVLRDLTLAELPMAYYGPDLWLAIEDSHIDQLRVRRYVLCPARRHSPMPGSAALLFVPLFASPLRCVCVTRRLPRTTDAAGRRAMAGI